MSGSVNNEQYPIDSDRLGLYQSPCVGLGGIRTPLSGALDFTPVVVNEEDNIWRDDDYVPVQENTGEVFVIDNA